MYTRFHPPHQPSPLPTSTPSLNPHLVQGAPVPTIAAQVTRSDFFLKSHVLNDLSPCSRSAVDVVTFATPIESISFIRIPPKHLKNLSLIQNTRGGTPPLQLIFALSSDGWFCGKMGIHWIKEHGPTHHTRSRKAAQTCEVGQ